MYEVVVDSHILRHKCHKCHIYIYRQGRRCYLVFNSERFFLDLITSAQQLSGQRGVIMEVPRS